MASLNPCSNGIAIEFVNVLLQSLHPGLNPCSNGIAIEFKYCNIYEEGFIVLILVLME